MSLQLPIRCWRGRGDCEPLGAVDAPPEGVDEAAYLSAAYEPVSFVCCGCVAPEARSIPQDSYRVCWRTPLVDERGDYDEQDLAHLMLVLAQGAAVIATRRVNGGMIEVPTRQGAMAGSEGGEATAADPAG